MQELAILGLFSSREQAQAAAAALAEIGLGDGRIRIGGAANAVDRGESMVAAQVDGEGQFERAAQALMRCHALDIGRQSVTWHGAGVAVIAAQDAQTDADRARLAEGEVGDAAFANGPIRIPVIEERLKIEKRLVQRGCVQVFTRIEEIPIQERVALRVERLLVERHAPGCTPAAVTDADNRQVTYELRELAEEAVVERNPCVIEEIIIGREVTEREVVVSDVMRRSSVEVRRIGAGGDGAAETL